MGWEKIAFILIAAVMIWLMFRAVKGNPASLSKESINKSAATLGVLALALIAFVGFLVFLLKQSQ